MSNEEIIGGYIVETMKSCRGEKEKVDVACIERKCRNLAVCRGSKGFREDVPEEMRKATYPPNSINAGGDEKVCECGLGYCFGD